MEKKISDLLNNILYDSTRMNVEDSFSVDRIKELTMNKVVTGCKLTKSKGGARYLMVAAVTMALVVLSGAALAAAGVIDFGAFYDSFFRNPKVTGAVTPGVSDKSDGIGITLTNAYTDGLTMHLVLQVTGLADTEFNSILFQTDSKTGQTLYNRDGFTFSDGVFTIPATIYLPGTEAEKTGHVALVITRITFDSFTENERVIDGNWDLSFDIKLPDADKTHMNITVKAKNSDYIDEVTFDMRPATFEVIFTAKGGNQDLNAFTEYFNSFPEPVLTLYDGTVVRYENTGNYMIDSTMGSWWVNTEYFDICELKSITFCGQTYDIEQRRMT